MKKDRECMACEKFFDCQGKPDDKAKFDEVAHNCLFYRERSTDGNSNQ